MAKDDMEIVSELQSALAEAVGQDRYDLWFGSNSRFTLETDALTVTAPNEFFQDWLRAHFRRYLEDACEKVLGSRLAVRFTVDATLQNATTSPSAQAANGHHSNQSAVTARAEQSPPAPQPTETAPSLRSARSNGVVARRPFAVFDDFVVAPSNRVAHVSAQTAASEPGSFSPLVLYGPAGVGKTHLLESIWSGAKKAHPGIQAVYLTAEQFTTSFLEGLRGSGLPNFRRRYRGVELLLIDDLQFFAGKKATLIELLHTVDTLSREGRQLVFACDRAPAEFRELGPELQTRLLAGLACRMDPPEYETRLAIAQRMALKMKLRLTPEIYEFVARHSVGGAREIAGALKRLHATSRALGRELTFEVAEEALAEVFKRSAKSVGLADIDRAICEEFGLDSRLLKSEEKRKTLNHPRMLAMWLARKHTRTALSEIGQHFGRRSHSTVISAQKTVDTWVSRSATVRISDHTCTVEDAIRRVEARLSAG